MNDFKIAATYIRVSTDDQIELSPASQLTEIRRWASKNGYVVPDEFVFTDEGISGRKVTGRDAFRQMIGTAKQKPKPFEAILLWKFSRFARNRDDAVFYKSVLRKQLGIDVISVSEPILDGKMGIITEALIEAMDEYYSINLAEEVRRGMTEKHRRGEFQAAPPFGYRVENNVLTPLQPEAYYVQEMFRRFCSGEGFYSIAKAMNAHGLRTHRGSPFENRTVEYILRNPVYIGKLRWNPTGKTKRNFADPNIQLVDGKHEPLIDLETWNITQQKIADLKAILPYHAKPLGSNKTWFSGLIRCASCDATLIFAKPDYWKCNNYVRGRCKTSQHIRTDLLKAAILSRLQQDCTTNLPLEYEMVRSQTPSARRYDSLTAQQQLLRRKLERLREAYLAGAESVEDYKAMKQQVEAQLSDVAAQISESDAKAETAATPEAIRTAIREALTILTSETTTLEEKATAARSIISRATWNKSTSTLHIIYHFIF